MKKGRGMLLYVIIAVAAVLIFNFTTSFMETRKTPSDKWSKEVLISRGTADNEPKMISGDDCLIVANETESGFKVTKTDLKGKVIGSESFDVDSDFIRNMMLLKGTNGTSYLTYNRDGISEAKLEIVELDSELKEVSRKIIKGIINCYQIDSDNLVIYKKGSLVYYNISTERRVDIPCGDASLITGARCGDSIEIAYMEGESLKGVNINKTAVSEPVEFMKCSQASKLTYGNLTGSGDNEHCVFTIDQYFKGELNGTKYVEINLNSREVSEGDLLVDKWSEIRNIRGVYSKEGIRFFGTVERAFGSKSTQKNIVEFSFENGRATDINMVSRLRELCINGYSDGEYVIYLSYDYEGYNVNLGSTLEDFKAVNNGFKISEVKAAFIYTVEGFFMGASYILILGVQWILPALFITSVLAMTGYKINEEKKKYIFYLCALVTAVFKAIALHNTIYMNSTAGFPVILSTFSAAVIIGGIMTAITFYIRDITYKDTERMTIMKTTTAIFADALFTCMVFVPLIA